MGGACLRGQCTRMAGKRARVVCTCVWHMCSCERLGEDDACVHMRMWGAEVTAAGGGGWVPRCHWVSLGSGWIIVTAAH